MKKTTGLGSKRTLCSIGLLCFYYFFIGAILFIVYSQNPNELVQQLMPHQWVQYALFCGLCSGIYLSISSTIKIAPVAEFYFKNKSYRAFGLIIVEFIVQLVWMMLPIDLIQQGDALRQLNPAVVIGSISFAVSLATFRRLHIQRIDGFLTLQQAF